MGMIDRVFPPKPGHPSAPAPAVDAAPAAEASAATAVLAPGGGAAVAPPGDLLERRTQLAEQLATLQWDLGGLTYEMAVRDHFRLDVLIRAAARLQDVDAQLGEVERLVRMEEGGAAGTCPSCEALHSRGAQFCSRCGHQLMEAAAPTALPAAGNGHRPAL